MSLTCSLCAITPMTPVHGRQLLMDEPGMVVSARAPLTVVDEAGLTVVVSLPLDGRVLRKDDEWVVRTDAVQCMQASTLAQISGPCMFAEPRP